jgi:hypothetical protein
MITKSIPGQLAYQTVILVKIVSAMREDYIGCENFLEFLEALFDRRTEVGKETISKRFHHYSLLVRPPQERIGAALGFFATLRIGTEDEPVELDGLRPLDHSQHGAAAPDLDVVAVRSHAEHPL